MSFRIKLNRNCAGRLPQLRVISAVFTSMFTTTFQQAAQNIVTTVSSLLYPPIRCCDDNSAQNFCTDPIKPNLVLLMDSIQCLSSPNAACWSNHTKDMLSLLLSASCSHKRLKYSELFPVAGISVFEFPLVFTLSLFGNTKNI